MLAGHLESVLGPNERKSNASRFYETVTFGGQNIQLGTMAATRIDDLHTTETASD